MSLLKTLLQIDGDDILRQFDVRLAVSTADRDAAALLIQFSEQSATDLNEIEAEENLLEQLVDSINQNLASFIAGKKATRSDLLSILNVHDVRVALNALFWFTWLRSARKAEKERAEPVMVRSIWIQPPQRVNGAVPGWYANGISVDAMMQSDHETILWAIRSGDNEVLGKDGEWEWSPMPSSRTDEFYERTRWDSMQDAIDFAVDWLAKYNHDEWLQAQIDVADEHLKENDVEL